MERSYYQEYFFFEQDNWWFLSRRRILMSVLRKYLPRGETLSILDAGCGTGINLDYLTEFGDVHGTDFSQEAIDFCRKRGHDGVRQMDLTKMEWEDGRFDLVTALDVIEHIDNDAAATSEIIRVAKPGGWILITVPAFPSLWSEHDEINHHKRRYRGRELLELVQPECDVVKFTYMNSFLFPIAWGVRHWQRFQRRLHGPPNHPPRTDFVDYHPVVNSLLTAVFTSETPFIRSTGLPFGLSMLCLARKRTVNGGAAAADSAAMREVA